MGKVLLASAGVLLLLAAGCGRRERPEPAERAEPAAATPAAEQVVAEYSGGRITARDVFDEEDFWNAGNLRMPRMSYLPSPESATDLVRFIASREYFAKVAELEGLDRDPEYLEAMSTAHEEALGTLYRANVREKTTQEEARQYYEANQRRFTSTETFRFRNVFVQCDKENPEEKEWARERAAAALAELRAGGDFGAVERKWSTRREEELGREFRAARGVDINPLILEFLESAEPEEISEALEVRHGFMVVQLLQHDAATTRPFEAVEEACREGAVSGKVRADLAAESERRGIRIIEERLYDPERQPADVVAEGNDFALRAGEVFPLPKAGPGLNEATRNYMMEQVQQTVNRRLLAEMALRSGLDADQRLRDHLETYTRRVLSVMALDLQIGAQEERLAATEEELRREYETNDDVAMRREQTQIRVINIPSGHLRETEPDKVHFAWERARGECEELYARIQSGEDFAALAREYSTGYNAEEGGLLPFEEDGPRGHSIDMAVDKLELGEVSPPTRYTRGYMLIKLEAVKPPERKPFDEVREQLAGHIRWRKAIALRDEILRQVCESLFLVIYPPPAVP